MRAVRLTQKNIEAFKKKLKSDGKIDSTVSKYCSDLNQFSQYLGDRTITKDILADYKEELKKKYKPSTVNDNLSAINSYLEFKGNPLLKVSHIRIDRVASVNKRIKPRAEKVKSLTSEEYERLQTAINSEENSRLFHIMLAISKCGINVDELEYITIEALKKGDFQIPYKDGHKIYIIPEGLKKRFLSYAEKKKISAGPIFITETGELVDRIDVIQDMQQLCEDAQLGPEKVFPYKMSDFEL